MGVGGGGGGLWTPRPQMTASGPQMTTPGAHEMSVWPVLLQIICSIKTRKSKNLHVDMLISVNRNTIHLMYLRPLRTVLFEYQFNLFVIYFCFLILNLNARGHFD